jgi:hypothetical protein
MATLAELSRKDARRKRDTRQYECLRELWERVQGSWPSTPEEAGKHTLFYAVSLAFFYKGQTDYPDLAEADKLYALLTRCAHLYPGNEAECAQLLQELDALPGVGIARASTILHCLHPDGFPIVDRNAATAVCKWAGDTVEWPREVTPPTADATHMTQDVQAYLDYRRVLLALTAASKGRLTLRQVELALYNAGREDKSVTGL